MRNNLRVAALTLLVGLCWANLAFAQPRNPAAGFKRAFDLQIVLVIAGVAIVVLMLVWGLFKFVIGAAFVRGRDNANRDLGGWKPPMGNR